MGECGFDRCQENITVYCTGPTVKFVGGGMMVWGKVRFDESGVEALDWPTQSRDSRYIKHLWDEMEKRSYFTP